MKIMLGDGGVFDTRVEPSDWRYSASIVGIIRFFDWVKFNEALMQDLYKIDEDGIEFNDEELTRERYLSFAEDDFCEWMHHKLIEEKLPSYNEWEEEDIKAINELLKKNTVCKRIFKGLSADKKEDKQLLEIAIENGRQELISDTFKNGRRMYAKFINPNCFLDGDEKNKTCRLIGYNVDGGRKTKALSYHWDYNTYVYQDDFLFDFIPFAFSKDADSFFINNNASIQGLINANKYDPIEEQGKERTIRQRLFENTQESASFIDYDVEVIVKRMETAYFETVIIRKDAIEVLESIENYRGIKRMIQVSNDYYRNLENETIECILQLVALDELIELLFKRTGYWFSIKTLIEINQQIYIKKKGGREVDTAMKGAYACARQLVTVMEENKLKSYKNKLISAITFKDYNRFCEILLQLSSYSGIVFNFAYDLYENFEVNKNIAYTFINALNNEKNGGKNK